MSESYKIVRMFFDRAKRSRVIKRDLTLAEAQEYCGDPETSSSTCKSAKRIHYTNTNGAWFDGYEEEK